MSASPVESRQLFLAISYHLRLPIEALKAGVTQKAETVRIN